MALDLATVENAARGICEDWTRTYGPPKDVMEEVMRRVLAMDLALTVFDKRG